MSNNNGVEQVSEAVCDNQEMKPLKTMTLLQNREYLMRKSNYPKFTALTFRGEGLAHWLITPITISEEWDPNNVPKSPINTYSTRALWDTGCTTTCISTKIVKALNLTPIRQGEYASPLYGKETCKFYSVNILLPCGHMVYEHEVNDFRDFEYEDPSRRFEVMIGMDLIQMGDFAITNVGEKTRMSFRIPSIKTIDYNIEYNKIRYANIPRNAPCPCGKMDETGVPLKFKFCCLPEMENY